MRGLYRKITPDTLHGLWTETTYTIAWPEIRPTGPSAWRAPGRWPAHSRPRRLIGGRPDRVGDEPLPRFDPHARTGGLRHLPRAASAARRGPATLVLVGGAATEEGARRDAVRKPGRGRAPCAGAAATAS